MHDVELDERGVIVRCPQCGAGNRFPYERLGQTARCAKCRADLPSPDEPIDIPDEETFAALTERSSVPVLVDFWAAWCGPCKMMAPEVAKASHAAEGAWVAAKLDTEALPSVAARFQISAIPLLVFFKDGRELAREAGARPAAAIRAFVEQHL